MSLLDDAMEECVMMDKRTTTRTDGYGGFMETWEDGASFRASVAFDTSMQARTANQQGTTDLYTVYTNKAVNLQYHDVFRRLSDGKIFRVTSDGDDKKTPASAALNIRVVTAQEWELPSNT